MKKTCCLVWIAAGCLVAQTTGSAGTDAWKALGFLEGTWEARTAEGGAAAADGTYTFRKELGGHVLARYTATAGCKGPADFDCEHRDLLYIYEDAPGQPLKAIYFDSEGHVIHYSATAPAAGSAVLVSDPSVPGPQFRLVYDLKGAVLSGKFQMHMPGQDGWKSYLEWSGSRKP